MTFRTVFEIREIDGKLWVRKDGELLREYRLHIETDADGVLTKFVDMSASFGPVENKAVTAPPIIDGIDC